MAVEIVTGGNKGIGYAIVKGLCEKFEGTVYLTSRNAERGAAAVKKLNELNFKPAFYQLDVDNVASVQKLHDFIKEKHGGIDLLVNNAGIAFNHNATEPFGYQAVHTLKTNYFGLLNVCNVLFPLLRKDAKVVNVSSCYGHLSRIPSNDIKAKLANDDLTIDELSSLMAAFIESAKSGTNVELGWGISAYNVSKVGVSALTRIQQRIADNEKPNRNLHINSVHPGYVNTDLTNNKGPLTAEEGARAPLFLSLEKHGWKGKYVWRDSTDWDWLAESTPSPY